MELHENPILQQENYFDGYQKSIDDFKNHPEQIEFDRICYELFTSDLGKRFMDIIKDRYLIPALVNREAKNYNDMVIWADGFKDFPRMILQYILFHEQRIKAGANNA